MPPKVSCLIEIKKVGAQKANEEILGECNICMANLSQCKYILCQMCKGTTCTDCQLEYGKPFCANSDCNYQYTQYQLILTYSKEVLDNSNMGKYWREIYLDREKQLLPLAQTYIDHVDLYEKYRRNMRFGSFNKIQPVEKKKFEDFCTSRGTILQKCPSTNCNSYIIGSTMFCQKCNIKFCEKCNEPETPTHVCDEATIKCVIEIKANSKPCPNCYIRIQKSEGCDHMRCTNCSTFFSYSTLKIQKKNSSSITDDEVFGKKNLPKENSLSEEEELKNLEECSDMTISLPHNKLTSVRFENCHDTEGLIISGDHQYMKENVLINRDPYSLLYIYNNNYQLYKINYNYMKSLFNDRLKFLKGSLKIDKWIDNIYKNEFEYHRSIAITDVLRSYLNMIADYITEAKIDNTLFKNIKMYNLKLEEIFHTYGGTLFKINDVNSVDTVSWIIDKKKVIL